MMNKKLILIVVSLFCLFCLILTFILFNSNKHLNTQLNYYSNSYVYLNNEHTKVKKEIHYLGNIFYYNSNNYIWNVSKKCIDDIIIIYCNNEHGYLSIDTINKLNCSVTKLFTYNSFNNTIEFDYKKFCKYMNISSNLSYCELRTVLIDKDLIYMYNRLSEVKIEHVNIVDR